MLTAPANAKPIGPLPATCAVRYLPTSANDATYVAAFAPEIATHPNGTVVKPDVTGCEHRNQKIAIDGEPVHVPVFTVHVAPTLAEPDTVGATVFTGTPPEIAVVLTAPANAKPVGLLPASWAVKYLPTSATVALYVAKFAPLIAVHPDGTVVNALVTGWSQRNQNMPIDGVGAPVHVPVSTVHVWPTSGVPDTVGATVFTGGVISMAAVLIAPARANPSGLLPATCAVRNFPTSTCFETYIVLFAPGMATQPGGTVVKPEEIAWLHRSQKILIVGSGAPVHAPMSTLHADPTVVAPVTVGRALLYGNPTGTTLTAPDSANPRELFPATCAVRYLPRSACFEVYVKEFAPLMAVHPDGTVVYCAVSGWSHRSQKIAMDGVGVPTNVPGSTVQVAPSVEMPVTVDGTTLAGLPTAEVAYPPDTAEP